MTISAGTESPFADDPLYTVAEVAKMFQVTEYTVRTWLQSGLMAGVKLPNNSWRMKKSELKKFAEGKYS